MFQQPRNSWSWTDSYALFRLVKSELGSKAYPMYWVNCWDRGLYVEREPFQANLGSRWNDRSLEEWRNNLELGCSVLSYIVDQRLGNVRLNFITWTAPLQESDNYMLFWEHCIWENIRLSNARSWLTKTLCCIQVSFQILYEVGKSMNGGRSIYLFSRKWCINTRVQKD